MSGITLFIILVVGAIILLAAIIFSGRARGHGCLGWVARLLGGFLTASIIGTLALILTAEYIQWTDPGNDPVNILIIYSGIAFVIGGIAMVVGFVLTHWYLEKKKAEEDSS